MTKFSFLDKLWTLSKVSPQIEELNQIPLFGSAPSFDWQSLSDELKKRLEIETVSLRKLSQKWRESESLGEGLGADVMTFPIDIPSLSGTVYWMMARQDIQKLTSFMLSREGEPKPSISPILAEGFYRYLLLEALGAACQIEPLKTFTPILRERSERPNETAFCVDIELGFAETASIARLLVPQDLLASFRAHFSKISPETLSPTLARNLELSLSVQIGSSMLFPSQLKPVKKGDFILLDKGSYDPRHLMGAAFLVLGSTPLFQVNIESQKIHLLNHAFIYEDATDMEHDIPKEDDFEEEIPSFTPAEEAEAVALKEAPIHITVELARLKMTLERLTQLAPGNVLELPIESDQIATLSVGGKKIGKAELVYLGENLGVRILELG